MSPWQELGAWEHNTRRGGYIDLKFLLFEMRDMIYSNQLNPLASPALHCALQGTRVEGRRELNDLSRRGGTNVRPAPIIDGKSESNTGPAKAFPLGVTHGSISMPW